MAGRREKGVPATADIFLFGEFRLDLQGDGLSRRDERGVFVPVPIGLRALDVLCVLVERAGHLVLKEEIMAAVWGRTVVENANLTVQISALRRILDEARSEGSCIQTVAARGYRFIAPVTRVKQGEQQLKNIEQPVRAYAVGDVAPPTRHSPRPIVTSRLAAAAIILAVAAIGTTAWWAWPRLSPPATTAQAGPTTNPASASDPKSAPRLSIVVLPFANLSNDPEQQYFVDGVTEDLTTDLSRITSSFVISANSAFTYKGKSVDAKQIGRELGVRYVLEGSVQRSGDETRVNAQLIDAATDTHLWAERFDHDIGDLFALQNEITDRIANTLGWQLISAETIRKTDQPDALEYILRGRAVMGAGNLPENNEKAVDLFEHAFALDPSSVETQSRLANALINRSTMKGSAAAAADLRRAEELIGQALTASPSDPYPHYVKGKLLRFTRRCEEAIREFEIFLAANRNDPSALMHLSACKYVTGGSDKEAIALVEQAIRLSPRDPSNGQWHTWIGFVHLMQSRVDEAIVWLEKARSMDPRAFNTHAFLATAYGLKGEKELAVAEMAESQRLIGSDRYSSIARIRANGDLYTPALRERWETVFFPGARAAGLPEQ